MKKYKWELKLGIILIGISFILYYIDYRLFGTASKIYDNILTQIAFLPIYVLIVTMVLEQVLYNKEKQAVISKMNMVVGLFFSEIGIDLLKIILCYDMNLSKSGSQLYTEEIFNDKYKFYIKKFKDYQPDIQTDNEQLISLRLFMEVKREFLLQLMQNPNLLEHESFTELMLSVFHLLDELNIKDDFKELEDHKHINLDIERAYLGLILEWLSYMKHLKEEYPYLYSIKLRQNPFKR
ncbi:MAG: hypothetical protein LIR50_13850 [Bacillota bacterium]|nr:hypothetical protein [Bacillota bacterium]